MIHAAMAAPASTPSANTMTAMISLAVRLSTGRVSSSLSAGGRLIMGAITGTRPARIMANCDLYAYGSCSEISSGFRSYGSIACMFVIMGAFPLLEDMQERADGAVEGGDGACGKLAQVRLEFAIRQFDRVEVG